MKFIDGYRLTPLQELFSNLYNIERIQTRSGHLYATHKQIVKILSGDGIVGVKKYTEDFTANGKNLVNAKFTEFSQPILIRFADETKDAFRLDSEYLESNGFSSYKIVAEVINVINYFAEDGTKQDEFITSEIVVGC